MVPIKRGSFVTSRATIAKDMKMTEQEVRTAIDHLISTGEITKTSTNKLTILTINNYESYQEIQPTTQPIDNHDNNHQNNHNKEYKEEKNIDIDANASLSDSRSDDEINYAGLIKYWNETTKGVWGELRDIKNNRLKMVRARVREHGKAALVDAIKLACDSSYLRGATWFNFDWMIKPNNFDKLLAGNYNREQQAQLQLEINNVRLGFGEQIDQQGNRFYMQGKTKVIVPIDAPPRQSNGYYWSDSQQKWYYNGM